jgi:ACR3 family arsenite efflux pump ArsB
MIGGRLPWLLVFQVLGVLATVVGALVAVPFLVGLGEIVRELHVEPRREA